MLLDDELLCSKRQQRGRRVRKVGQISASVTEGNQDQWKIYRDQKHLKETRNFWELKSHHFCGLDVSEQLGGEKKDHVSMSEDRSFLLSPRNLQMRGGADKHQNMGHKGDVFPNPQDMCLNFHPNAFWVCQHQLLSMWGSRDGEARRTSSRRQMKDKQQLAPKVKKLVSL